MKIQNFCKSVGNGGCLAMCYIKAALPDATPTMIFTALWTVAEKGIVDAADACYVKDAVKLMNTINPSKRYSVTKQKISSLSQLDGKLAAVNFKNGNFNHWVLVENNKIIFDSLEDSQCVKYGTPVDARIIEVEDR